MRDDLSRATAEGPPPDTGPASDMTGYYSDEWLDIHEGDCRAVLLDLEPESVHCVVTSPPYWGLRDYGTATWTGGDPACDHRSPTMREGRNEDRATLGGGIMATNAAQLLLAARTGCGKCGAIRIDSQLGLEPTPEEYVAALVDVFREVRRVLRADGTVWLNLGDSYASTGGEREYGSSDGGTGRGPGTRRYRHVQGAPDAVVGLRDTGPSPTEDQAANRQDRAGAADLGHATAHLKPKDLVGIPWRVAFALQADGWYLRSDIIWSKPNPMPESVTDRPTKSHEYLFLLSKSARYFFDGDAVREAPSDVSMARIQQPNFANQTGGPKDYRNGTNPNRSARQTLENFAANPGRNIRSVWNIATAPYPGAHFATFPPKLVEPCIKAGTSERGVCPECGAPWERMVERQRVPLQRVYNGAVKTEETMTPNGVRWGGTGVPSRLDVETTGWRPTCAHTAQPVPAVVLDPFAGTGTVGLVAQRLSRRAVLIDLNADYLRQCLARAVRAWGVGGPILEDKGTAAHPEDSLWRVETA